MSKDTESSLAAFKAVAGALKDNSASLGKAPVTDVTIGLYYLWQQRQTSKSTGDRIKEAFWQFDKDKTFTITREKLQAVFTTLEPSFTQGELDLLFDSADKNGNGVIEYDEFLDFIMGMDIPDVQGQRQVSKEDISDLIRRCDLAECAYSGNLGFEDDADFPMSASANKDNFDGKPPANLEALIQKSISGLGGTLEYANVKGQFRQPVHFVAIIGARVVLSIRGTASLTDIMTDLECGQVELPKGISDVETVLAHAGFAQSAEWVVGQSFDVIVEALGKAGPEAQLEVVGHSLGAGVATLTFLHLRKKLQDAEKLPAVCKCFGFATPPCLSAELAADAARLGITSIVLQDDIIPRLSQHNVERLRAEILCDTDWKNMLQADFEKTKAGAVAKELGVKYESLQKDMTEATESYTNAAKETILAFTGKDDYEFGDITKAAAKKASNFLDSQAQNLFGISPFANKKSSAEAGEQKKRVSEDAQVDVDELVPSLARQDSKAVQISQLPPILLPPGRIVFLRRMDENLCRPKIVRNDHFQRIELSNTMVTDHLLGNYAKAFKSAKIMSFQ